MLQQCYDVHCIYVEGEVQMPFILSKSLLEKGSQVGWSVQVMDLDRLMSGLIPYFSWCKVVYLFSFVHHGGKRADSAGIRRCPGTCPICLVPSPPSNRPCRRARSLRIRGRLTSQTTVLGSFLDGGLNEEKENLLPRRKFRGTLGEVWEATEPWQHIMLKISWHALRWLTKR